MNSKNVLIRDCNKCNNLILKNNKPFCNKLDTRVYYRGQHPILPAYLNDCPLLSVYEKDLTKSKVNKANNV